MSDEKTKRSVDLAVGDVVTNLWTAQGPALVTKIEPYEAKGCSFIFAIATFVPGGRVTLTRETSWSVQ